MPVRPTYISLILLLGLSSCLGEEPRKSTGGTPVDIWLVPESSVVDSGVGLDGIPSLEEPPRINAEDADYLDDQDLVIGFFTGTEYRAYPHKILDWHEIINDRDKALHYSISYCPLTGTGMAWDMFLEGQLSGFGVSGLLYNTNLMPYDRRSGSVWSQMLYKCVTGEKVGDTPEYYAVLETTWGTWKSLYPNSTVTSTETGFERPYDVYPYIDGVTQSDYRKSGFLISPIDFDDKRLERKERVLGITINEEAKVYRFRSFEKEVSVIEDQFQGEEIVIAGSNDLNFMVGFFANTEDGTLLTFEAINNNLPAILLDNEGNVWDVFGYAISGPRVGEQLRLPKANMGYWFAWGTFFRDAEIYQ
jgi:hypothetical protein